MSSMKPFGQIGEHRVLALAPGADAGIDHDGVFGRLHDKALEIHPHLPRRRGIVRVQPVERDHLFRRGIGHGHVDIVLKIPDLDDPADLHVPDLPASDVFYRHRASPCFWFTQRRGDAEGWAPRRRHFAIFALAMRR